LFDTTSSHCKITDALFSGGAVQNFTAALIPKRAFVDKFPASAGAIA